MDLLSLLHQKLLFSPSDIAQETGGLRSATTLLSRYQRQGYVSKVRRGLYCVNNIATKLPEANKYQVASAITDSSFVAYHAAMEYHGLGHQLYYDVVAGSEQSFNGFDFDEHHYACHLTRLATGIEHPVGDRHVRVTSVERTIVDCIDRIDLCGGWEELVNCLRSVQYVREEQLGMPVSEALIGLCKGYAKESVLYLTTDGASDSFNAGWRLYAPKDLLTVNNG